MKKQLFFLLCLFAHISKAQQPVVFCPPGAEWSYLFLEPVVTILNQPYTYPKVKYQYEIVINGEIIKKLSCDVFYTRENILCDNNLLLKQHGDTIFMNCCKTNYTWQILYNFAAKPGQQWQTTVKDENFYSPNATPITHTITVNDTTTVNINGWNLKQLIVTYCYSEGNNLYCKDGTITERIGYQGSLFDYGGNGFLFNYHKSEVFTDYDILNAFLCYQDNDFPKTSFSSFGCDYMYVVNVNENIADKINVSIYPNPAADIVTVELLQSNKYDIKLSDMLGLVCQEISLAEEKTEINLSGLSAGVYLIQVFEKGKLIATQKVIKE